MKVVLTLTVETPGGVVSYREEAETLAAMSVRAPRLIARAMRDEDRRSSGADLPLLADRRCYKCDHTWTGPAACPACAEART